MTVKPRIPDRQLNLALRSVTPAKLPPGDQQELALALVDLLVRAAQEGTLLIPRGGANESQTDD